MHLKVLLPFGIFADLVNISMIIAETNEGSFGILPNRLDCVASLVPGILSYVEVSGKRIYLGIDKGVLIKTGDQVFVSVRNAIGGVELGRLRDAISKEFKTLDEDAISVRSVMAKLETGFIRNFEKFHHAG